MCTVSFIPVANGAIITSNRDEHISRGVALYPEFYRINNRQLAFPKDGKAGGTWFISNEQGDVGVLLNGAFTKHVPSPPYEKSRGMILPELFQFDSPLDALKKYNFSNIENFTLILWEKNQLREFKWDAVKLKMKLHNSQQPHIWSSVTLYDETMTGTRHGWFAEWLKSRKVISQKDILEFHSNTHSGNTEYGLRIKRDNKISTTSITSLRIEQQKAEFYHKDLIQNIDSVLTYDLRQVQLTNALTTTESEIAQKN